MLNKIDFHSESIRSLLSIQITKILYFPETTVKITKTTSILTCHHYPLCGDLIHPIFMKTIQTPVRSVTICTILKTPYSEDF